MMQCLKCMGGLFAEQIATEVLPDKVIMRYKCPNCKTVWEQTLLIREVKAGEAMSEGRAPEEGGLPHTIEELDEMWPVVWFYRQHPCGPEWNIVAFFVRAGRGGQLNAYGKDEEAACRDMHAILKGWRRALKGH